MTAETSVPSSALLTGADRDGSNYTARHLLVLEGLEAVRKRPGMYIGSTDSRGLMHCVWEIIDNSVDEALGGHCDYIEVILGEDASIEVRDNGRGIPVDVEPKTGLSGVEVVMTKLHAGGKFGGGSYAASGGLHGVGASVVNALSARLDVEVDRSGHTHAISFRRGVPGSFSGAGPDAAFDPASGVKKAKKVPRTRTGTRVRYWADRQIFLKDAKLSLETLHQRARQTAFLVPGLTIVVRDERGIESDKPVEETFHFDGGISEFCEFLAPDKPICDVLRLTGSGTFKETVPVLDDRGHMTPTEVTRELGVDIALRWGTGYDTTARSFVNIIATPKGGTHVTGFERSVTRTMNEALRAAKLLRVAEDDIVKDDAMEGLTAVVTVRLAEPQFEGQTKEVLGTSAANRIVATVVAKELKEFLTSTKRDAKVQARAVLEKAVAAARTRIAARQHKEAQRRKTALETSSLPAKLADCRSDDVERSELFIVEGDSALGTAKLARSSEFQALLPIRGKILNTQKSSVSDMLKNAECGAIIQVIGAGSGRTFDIDQARYGKVIFLADADVDGAHIRCLLLTLFQRYMRPMVEEGRVFSAVPPLHRIELVQPKKGQDKYIYTYSDSELRQTLLDLQRRNVRYKDGIQRYKGLGEMDANQLAETTMDPRHRTLRRINISDIEAAEQAFDLLMGNEVAPRKEFITNSATTLDRSKIDV
ncbi:type IIA DNA topoisomerase subunit B [Streptomyces cocklensis]|uniref:DNA topoisomerase (ATP-hydrolyzing) n=1 Tax=Actinacidiphila cocklensis TaxID=887465 RepID=A0A9W4DML4_9ACTN|nr:DNA topoisomerase IV subunit B [Actinacidiphila cocklensis]MDD1059622.1 type IIA DNA topoisomerase subunit B [Actinacidiphila cocklensis]WSX76385.1 type IIA DNA topoisomerase subunit B [Streptomyces sp. NBC_00899]CAG6392902.1 DNA gyrase subunit B [Actinacidiphila cocklensis]